MLHSFRRTTAVATHYKAWDDSADEPAERRVHPYSSHYLGSALCVESAPPASFLWGGGHPDLDYYEYVDQYTWLMPFFRADTFFHMLKYGTRCTDEFISHFSDGSFISRWDLEVEMIDGLEINQSMFRNGQQSSSHKTLNTASLNTSEMLFSSKDFY